MHHLKATFAFIAAFAVTGSAAFAKPNVQLKLDGELVQLDAKGAEKLVPVSSVALKPGETIRYDIVASNVGPDAAKTLMPIGKIPAGTAYEPGTASVSNASRVEFSIDGGKTWSVSPTIKVQTPSGIVEQKADPSRFTAIRWIGAKPLLSKSSVAYSYEVRIK